MQPLTKPLEQQDEVEKIQLQEQPFVRQVEDDSLPAGQVLIEQREHRERDEPAPLFVP